MERKKDNEKNEPKNMKESSEGAMSPRTKKRPAVSHSSYSKPKRREK
jgi:hypothetical protein